MTPEPIKLQADFGLRPYCLSKIGRALVLQTEIVLYQCVRSELIIKDERADRENAKLDDKHLTWRNS